MYCGRRNRCLFSLLAMLTLLVCLGCQSQVAEPDADPPSSTDATEPTTAATPPAQLPDLLPEAALADGWISLFDGQTLFGWQPDSDANWRVEEGSIVVDQGAKGLLHTTTRFADYVLKIEFRSAPGTNSGIFLHTPPTINDVSQDVYELNIADADNPFPTGSLVNRKKVEGTFDSEDWQAYEITVDGDQITVDLDGERVMEYQDPNPLRRGTIALQLNEGKVEFRNIQLKPLHVASIFNAQDLTGWVEYPEMATKFSVTDEGFLNARNTGEGRGQLETADTYGDFVLQLECMTHGKSLNSGVFFRCIPGETMNGYESQIQNGFKNGDRSQPEDCGTGGIFRRQNARLVVADDETWFYKTLIADGPHIATWVNGYQVSDWTDERAPDPNPRKGLRTEAGTMILQGHDPTTNLSFRNLQAVELTPRAAPAE